jgi:hypothetical protein
MIIRSKFALTSPETDDHPFQIRTHQHQNPCHPSPHKSLYKLSNTVAFSCNSQFPTFPNLSLDFVHLQHFIVVVVVGEADLRSKFCSD